MFLDQAWHRIQRSLPFSNATSRYRGRVVLAEPAIHKERAKAVAGLCRKIAKHIGDGKSDVAYAFRYDPDAYFDKHTGQLALPSGKGLTCVTYALVVFKSAQVPIIDFEGWNEREDDRKAHESLIEALKPDIDAEHLKALQDEVRCVRCRPEEICGACACLEDDAEAIKFDDASAAGLSVLAAIPPLPPPPLPTA